MRLRNITGSKEMIADNAYVIHEPEKLKGRFSKEVFGGSRPLNIEIGMGKGRFILTLAERDQEADYIGIEKYSTVLLKAVRKFSENPLDNLRFIRMDAEYITDVFDENEIDKIYLNFSDPWPKDRHEKRRLPSSNFLKKYERILKPGGMVEFKTDNRDLFDFGVKEAESSGWEMLYLTYDLHNDPGQMKNNIMTEYEAKFSALGNPIYKYIIRKTGSQDLI
ncbi:MAG: tRNA (guanosine(46)-N7)-methyltransferase TrmB [Lachnospiraceae bacterium]|nr:tRNA (guanosine(46)-N7)-methyltransferase TrmB [Lachnospiraceae bacterium]